MVPKKRKRGSDLSKVENLRCAIKYYILLDDFYGDRKFGDFY